MFDAGQPVGGDVVADVEPFGDAGAGGLGGTERRRGIAAEVDQQRARGRACPRAASAAKRRRRWCPSHPSETSRQRPRFLPDDERGSIRGKREFRTERTSVEHAIPRQTRAIAWRRRPNRERLAGESRRTRARKLTEYGGRLLRSRQDGHRQSVDGRVRPAAAAGRHDLAPAVGPSVVEPDGLPLPGRRRGTHAQVPRVRVAGHPRVGPGAHPHARRATRSSR